MSIASSRAFSIALSTDHLERSIGFYVDVLGFDCTLRLDHFARVRCGMADIMLSLPNAHVPWQGARLTGAIYLTVDDVETLWGSLKDKVRIVYPLQTMDYGVREFGILDDNGYQLSFAQPLSGDGAR